ncbi:MAG: hypothetical protein HWD60_00920 [Defluviicoccus sp.]|nr:MAG: hypothetical protein HWD60_00920 [Defluviicoccus sp.]
MGFVANLAERASVEFVVFHDPERYRQRCVPVPLLPLRQTKHFAGERGHAVGSDFLDPLRSPAIIAEVLGNPCRSGIAVDFGKTREIIPHVFDRPIMQQLLRGRGEPFVVPMPNLVE